MAPPRAAARPPSMKVASALRLLAALLAALVVGVPAVRAQSEPSPRVVVASIRGPLSTAAVYVVHRAVRTALDVDASRIVLEIDTPGGAVTTMREIEQILGAIRGTEGIKVSAFVSHQAWSAGGYLALACDETFMAPGSSLGAITPIIAGVDGAAQIPDDDVRAKALSVFRADVRALVERRGDVSADALVLAEALVDPRMEVFEVRVVEENGLERSRVVDQVRLAELEDEGVSIRSQRSIGRGPLTLTADEALRYGFSSGTHASIVGLVEEEFGLRREEILQIEESWSESGVGWLESIKPLLFVFGFILLLIEVKVPGLLLPGTLGVVLIALGLFSSFLVGLADWTEILLFFLGLGLIGVEMFVMPGTVVFGLAGFLSVVFALILSQQTFVLPENDAQRAILDGNLLDLLYLILLVVAGSIVFYRLLPRIPFFNRALLAPPDHPGDGDSTTYLRGDADTRSDLVGRRGVARTDLRPAGVFEAEDGRRLDVVARGAFVSRGARVRIVEVAGNRVVVETDVDSGERGEAGLGLLFLLIVVGLGLVIAEIFFISGGLLSVGAAVSLVSATFLAFTQHSQGMGFFVLLMEAIGVPLAMAFAFRILPKTPMGKKLLLEAPTLEEVSGAAQAAGLVELLGKSGRTESMLRPGGFARIDDHRVDVVTRGELIEPGVEIHVIQVDGNRVVVAEGPGKAVEPPAPGTA
jgi:membrane-bound serine protease (ClpP class)